MATTRKKVNGSKVPKLPHNPNRNRMISLAEIESFGAREIKKAFIPELDGCVSFKNTKAKGVLKFFEAVDKSTQLRAMANFIACALCGEDGEAIYQSEEAVLESLTSESIEAISLGIARARQEELESRGQEGNV